jgi:hypothetical protein
MSLVMIKCRHTARPVSTGLEVDDAQFAELPDVSMRCDCTACGMIHSWWKREAWLADYAGNPVTKPPPIRRTPKL